MLARPARRNGPNRLPPPSRRIPARSACSSAPRARCDNTICVPLPHEPEGVAFQSFVVLTRVGTQAGAIVMAITKACAELSVMAGVAAAFCNAPWCVDEAHAAAQEFVFVANADAGPVTAYPALSSGLVFAAVSIRDPHLPNTYWDPWGVALDAQQNLYVQTFLSDATTFVFPAGDDGSMPPSGLFRGDGPDSRSVAVDANGYEYVATGEGPSEIIVLPPGASGQPGNLYTVGPLRSIATDEAVWHPWPSLLTTDLQNHLIVAVVRAQGNAIEVFDGGATGSLTPIRVITGPVTGLGACTDTMCNTMAVTFSPLSGHLCVGVSAGQQTHISVFAGDAEGDTIPLRTIEGPATGLAGKVVTGIAESQRTGELFVLAKDAQFAGPGQVLVFGNSAQDNAVPVRAFTDASTQLADAAGIALAYESIPLGVSSREVGGVPRLTVGPNPTNAFLSVRLLLPRAVGGLQLQVLDPAGRSVAMIWKGDAPAGTLEASWDGRSAGQAAVPGVYVLLASGEGLRAQRRFVLIR